MTKFFLSLLVGLFLFSGFQLFTVASSEAAAYSCNPTKHEIDIYGDYMTNGQELSLFQTMVDTCKNVKAVRLINSDGGIVQEAFPIGLIVHQKGWDTIAEGHCNSACGYIWLAGNHRYIVKDTVMLEHLPNNNNLIDVDSFGDVYYYVGIIGLPEALAHLICSAANYYDNTAFDFVAFLNNHLQKPTDFYNIIQSDTDLYDVKPIPSKQPKQPKKFPAK